MNQVAEILRRYQPQLQGASFLIRPDLALKPLMTALSKYAFGVLPDEVLVHFDESENQDGKYGAVITAHAIYVRDITKTGILSTDLAAVESVEIESEKKLVLNGNPFLIIHGDAAWMEMLAEFVRELAALARGSDATPNEPEPRAPEFASIGAVLEHYLPGMVGSRCFAHPDIPAKKLHNALGSYAPDVRPEGVRFLYDNTIFRSAKDGILLTENALHISGMGEPDLSIQYEDLQTARLDERAEIVINEKHRLRFGILPPHLVRLPRMLRDIARLQRPDHQAETEVPLVRAQSGIEGEYRTPAPVENALRAYAPAIKGDWFHMRPDIPNKQLMAALDSYAPDVQPMDVLALYDNSPTHSGKSGSILTADAIYSSPDDTHTRNIKLADVSSVELERTLPSLFLVLNGQRLVEMNPTIVDMNWGGERVEKLPGFVRAIVALAKDADSDTGSPSIDVPEFQSVEAILDFHLPSLVGDATYVAPEIPEKKLHGALQKYAPDIDPDDVLFLFDGTVLGSAKEGVLLTKSAVCLSGLSCRQVRVRLLDVAFARVSQPRELTINGRHRVSFSTWARQMWLFPDLLRDIGRMLNPFQPTLSLDVAGVFCPKCQSKDLQFEQTAMEKATGMAVGGLLGAAVGTAVGAGAIVGEAATYAGAKQGAARRGSLVVCQGCGFRWKV